MPTAQPTSQRIYLDYNATSPLAQGVPEAVLLALAKGGNPSSPHAEGRAALRALEGSRRVLAETIGAQALDLVFTSGGTEANHLGFLGLAQTSQRRRVLLSPSVHPSLQAAGSQLAERGFHVESLPVDASGHVDMEHAQKALDVGDVALLAYSLANHETGAVQDAAILGALASPKGTLVFCDAVQAFGRCPVDVQGLAVDGLSLSAHKIGGPKGVGLLWLKPGPSLQPLIGGGKQESGRRPGTQATALIAGFAAAAGSLSLRLSDVDRQAKLRSSTEAALEGMGAIIHSTAGGLCNTISARFPGIAGELMVSSLDLAGIAISAGAACSSGATSPSQNLLGMGLSRSEALETIRISMGPATSDQDLQALLAALPEILGRARQFS